MPARHALKIWNAPARQWLSRVPKSWDGYGWSRPVGNYTRANRSVFYPRYFGEGTVWQRDVSQMPLATKSADYANWMATNLNYGSGFGPTGFNTSVHGTHSVQAHVVDSRIGTNKAYITGNFPGGYGASLLSGWVPWPDYPLKQQGGQDTGVVIWDIATGIVREYYWVQKVAGTENRYTAMTGGYAVYEPGFHDLTTSINHDSQGVPDLGSGYATRLREGTQTVVAQHNHLGFVDVAGCLNGKDTEPGTLNHAVAFTFANGAIPTTPAEFIRADGTRYTSTGPSWPAKGGDGDTPGDVSPVHGQWGRLPMVLDKPLNEYRPMTQTIIKACQTYGIVGTDTNNFVHAFNAEHADYWKQQVGGVDPWASGGVVERKYEAISLRLGYPAEQAFNVSDFPWHLTQWAPRNWGKPE